MNIHDYRNLVKCTCVVKIAFFPAGGIKVISPGTRNIEFGIALPDKENDAETPHINCICISSNPGRN